MPLTSPLLVARSCKIGTRYRTAVAYRRATNQTTLTKCLNRRESGYQAFAQELRIDIAGDTISPMRLVLDTNILVAAIRSSSGASNELIEALLLRKATLLLSITLFLEYQAICLLPVHRRASGISEEAVNRLLGSLADLAVPVDIYFQWRPQLRDPKDEMVLEAAVNGRADAIVTFNQRDFGQAPATFGVEVLRPGEVLRRIK